MALEKVDKRAAELCGEGGSKIYKGVCVQESWVSIPIMTENGRGHEIEQEATGFKHNSKMWDV